MSQLNLFTPSLTVHRKENNPASQARLDSQRPRLNDGLRKIYDLLMQGRVLTVKIAGQENLSNCFPRRIRDLRERGLKVSDHFEGVIKLWYCTESDKAHNRAWMKGGTE